MVIIINNVNTIILFVNQRNLSLTICDFGCVVQLSATNHFLISANSIRPFCTFNLLCRADHYKICIFHYFLLNFIELISIH